MKRFHVHVDVDDIDVSKSFYTRLFGAALVVVKPDYAKWIIDDPRVNFAISSRGHERGVNHLGFQVESSGELRAMRDQLEEADRGLVEERGVSCCHSKSDKYWVADPYGIAWEAFHSLGSVPIYGDDHAPTTQAACCTPKPQEGKSAKACCA